MTNEQLLELVENKCKEAKLKKYSTVHSKNYYNGRISVCEELILTLKQAIALEESKKEMA